MKILIIILLITTICSCTQTWSCNETYAIEQFKLKNSTGLFLNYTSNPYQNQDPGYIYDVEKNLLQNNSYCGLRYTDSSKINYELKTFESLDSLLENQFNVTHKGKCGVCSTTQDLTVYLEKDLTQPVRWCGLRYFYSKKQNIQCLLDLGFTYPCAQIWYYNTINTRKQCGGICFLSYIFNQPFVVDGHLNKCLQCDEDKSGPIFKYESGRTRRDSGIDSEIERPSDTIYDMDHCYY
ncbi:hypothetical protein ABPG74_012433 [Tetrahymena malaccensis]